MKNVLALLALMIFTVLLSSCEKEVVLISGTQPVEVVAVTLSKAEILALQKEAALWPSLTQAQVKVLFTALNTKHDTILSVAETTEILQTMLKDAVIPDPSTYVLPLDQNEIIVNNDYLTKYITMITIDGSYQITELWTFSLTYSVKNGKVDPNSGFSFEYDFDCNQSHDKILNKTTEVSNVKLYFIGKNGISFSYYTPVFREYDNQNGKVINKIKTIPFADGEWVATGYNQNYGFDARRFETFAFNCYVSDILDMVIYMTSTNIKSSLSIPKYLLQGDNITLVLLGQDENGQEFVTCPEVPQLKQLDTLTFNTTFNITSVRICNRYGCWEYNVELVKKEGDVSFYELK